MFISETQTLADEAAKKVVIKYKDIQKPILSMEDAIEAKSFHPCFIGTATVGNPDGEQCQLFLGEKVDFGHGDGFTSMGMWLMTF